ncbi:abc transporter transmembrane region domain-containing protein [Cystoisospora suis]|uniref:Abc transporter transmembrane region domain-containing protein n=1 Tax=Cystoisospora suis TaxID=483139 RepID=A0A2C6KKI4_9APIC|nr:abc transporter transmembrane region domain-containing protein [Cystoisospora suis]
MKIQKLLRLSSVVHRHKAYVTVALYLEGDFFSSPFRLESLLLLFFFYLLLAIQPCVYARLHMKGVSFRLPPLLLCVRGYPPVPIHVYKSYIRLRHWQSFQEKEIQGCNSFLADRLIHANTVYIHQEQEQEAYRFEEQQNKILHASHSSALVNGLFFGFLSFSVNATFLALLTYGMTLVKKGTLSYGNLTSFAVYSSMVGVGFSGLASLSSELYRAVQAGSRINTVLNLVKQSGHIENEREKDCFPHEEKRKCLIGSQEKNDLGTDKDQHHAEEAVTMPKEQEEEKEKEGTAPNTEVSSCPGFLPFLSSYEEREDKLEAENLLKTLQGEIKFRNVSFTYTSKNEISKKTASSSSATTADSPSSLAQVATPQMMIDLSPSLSDITSSTATTTSLDMNSSIVDPTPSAGNSSPGGDEKKPEHIDGHHLEEFPEQKQTTRGEKTTDTYEEDEEGLLSLKNISLSIPPGCITAITGQSGSGKTTLLKLLTKQINPTQGVITLDGTDLSVISTRVLLQKILGIVNPESSCLFSGLTIKENLFYGVWKRDSAAGIRKSEEMATEQKEVKKEASSVGDGQVSLTPLSRSMTACFKDHLFKEVCQLCNINGILENLTPAHENTRIEGSLSPFSSGEQQRLGLARALIKQPKILILDEATAHLDSHNERHLLQALRYLLKKPDDHSSSFATVSENEKKDEKDGDNGSGPETCHPSLLGNTVHTVVVIAHSKEALQIADNIVVLKKGEIVETGSYKDLIQKENGELTRLLKKQQH